MIGVIIITTLNWDIPILYYQLAMEILFRRRLADCYL